MHRFFLAQQLNDKEIIFLKDKALVHQIKRVSRLHKGDHIALFNTIEGEEGTDVVAEIKNIEGSSIGLLVKERLENLRESTKHLTLYCALIRKERFEWMLEKATEPGVREFVPFVAARSVRKNIQRARCETIIKEAMEQSGRAIIPHLYDPISFEQAIEQSAASQRKTFFAARSERDNMIRGAGDRYVNLFIGPEGGWDPKEIFLAREAHCEIVSLGRLTLRAETAAVVGSYTLLWG